MIYSDVGLQVTTGMTRGNLTRPDTIQPVEVRDFPRIRPFQPCIGLEKTGRSLKVASDA
jgi:hypothetical protein